MSIATDPIASSGPSGPATAQFAVEVDRQAALVGQPAGGEQRLGTGHAAVLRLHVDDRRDVEAGRAAMVVDPVVPGRVYIGNSGVVQIDTLGQGTN